MIWSYIFLGLISGVFSGIFGIGGGSILIPAMVFFFHLSQHEAQGTSLAVMLPPIFLLAVMRYYWAGQVKVQMALYIALGFFFGAFLGAQAIQGVSDSLLKRAFGIFLMLVGLKMAFFKS
jgi:uncharacterized protein